MKNVLLDKGIILPSGEISIGDFAIFNEEIMKKNKAFLSLYLVIF